MSDHVEIERAVRRLHAGGLVAFPTETVYGLGAVATDPDAVARVFEAKGRPHSNPLIVHVSDVEMARSCASAWPRRAQQLADAFWPGPLTIVVERGEAIPPIVTAGGPGVALRMPDHPLALELIRAVGRPLVGPSANRAGGVSPTTAAHVREAFGLREVLVLDGGPCQRGIESTVVGLLGERPRVLRPGVIGAAAIEAVVAGPVERGPSPGAAVESPGLLGRHYAPTAPVRLVERPDAASLPRGAVVLALRPLADWPGERIIAMPTEASAYARGLYAALRRADALAPDAIVVERPPRGSANAEEGAIWHAIADRLRRAAEA